MKKCTLTKVEEKWHCTAASTQALAGSHASKITYFIHRQNAAILPCNTKSVVLESKERARKFTA